MTNAASEGRIITAETLSPCGCGAFEFNGHRYEHNHGLVVIGAYAAMFKCARCEEESTLNLMGLILDYDGTIARHTQCRERQ